MKKITIQLYAQLKKHGAAILAMSAIFLALWEGIENRTHNRLSVLPRIESNESYDYFETKKTYKLSIYSSGLGPAVIRRSHVYINNELVFPVGERPMWRDIHKFLNTNKLKVEQSFAIKSGEFFPPGNSRKLLTVSLPIDSEISLKPTIKQIGAIVCYCSVYGGDCSYLKIGKTPNKKVCDQ